VGVDGADADGRGAAGAHGIAGYSTSFPRKRESSSRKSLREKDSDARRTPRTGSPIRSGMTRWVWRVLPEGNEFMSGFDTLHLAALRIKSATALMRMDLVLRSFAEVFEDKYSPNQPRAPKGTPEGGQWIVDPGSARQRQLAGERVRVAWSPMGFTKHGINQSINRGVSASAILDALNNPSKISPGSSPHSWKYYGSSAVVVLNPFGEVITLWPR